MTCPRGCVGVLGLRGQDDRLGGSRLRAAWRRNLAMERGHPSPVSLRAGDPKAKPGQMGSGVGKGKARAGVGEGIDREGEGGLN